MFAKFDEDSHNGLVSIMFVRSKCDWGMDVTTIALLHYLRG